ncbi:LexA family transcriptional regulator [Variovorax paradoxus]|uniref:HTH-type transcriptional regulator PrtR n=1 Tax=Variovorax paradoxus TaxID=34073 RepID=A0A679J9A3_VARPD|nr:HTH-type transcriptional regulator PrtR [Variovorax paradoxus]
MLSDRLKKAMDAAGISQAELARACGVKPPSVNGWLSGKAKFLRGENLLSAAKALNVSQQWLANGIGPMHASSDEQRSEEVDLDQHPDLEPVRVVKLRLQAGVSGFLVDLDESEAAPIFFRSDWLRRRGLKSYNLVAIRVAGQSMEPTLFADDVVVANTADKEPKDGEVFAVNYEGEPVIKRMSREGGSWWLSSDNQDQRRFAKKECTGDSCLVIGRIVHRQSERI